MLPLDVAAEFRLKSSIARNGLDLSLALWCDPGWHNSVLTFMLHNRNRYTTAYLTPGMKIGQAIFHQLTEPVPEESSYATKGQYNNDTTVQGSKELR